MLKDYRNALRLVSRNTWLVLIAAAMTGFSYTGIFIMLLNLYLLRLGFGPEFIGAINATAQLGFALFSLPAGALGQRWGSRKMTIYGLVIGAAAFGLLPLAELLPFTWRATWLMATYVLAWLAGALYLVNAYPFLMASTGPEERSYAFSIRQALVPLGTLVGNFSGGLLPVLLVTWLGVSPEQPAPYRYGLLAGVGALLIGVLALSATREVNLKQPQPRAAVAPGGAMPAGLMVFMAALMFFFTAAYGTAGTFTGVYMDERLQISTASIGTVMAVSQLLGVPVALMMPVIVTRWGKFGAIRDGLLVLAIGLLPLAFVPNWAAAGIGFIGVSVAYALITPALTLSQQEIVPPAWRATMSGAMIMARGSGTAFMAFGGGYLIDAYGYPSLFLSGALLAMMGAGLIWLYSWAPRWFLMRHKGVTAT